MLKRYPILHCMFMHFGGGEMRGFFYLNNYVGSKFFVIRICIRVLGNIFFECYLNGILHLCVDTV